LAADETKVLSESRNQ
jgi:hypothetical protein